MTKLNEWLTKDFIELIPYIKENESDKTDSIYAMLIMFYGNKPISSDVDNVVNEVYTKEVLANAIDMIFADKWKTIKSVFAENIPLLANTKTVTEDTNNSIYGYNGDKAPDYNLNKVTTEEVEYSDIFEMIEKNVAMRDKLAYYKIVLNDIATMLTMRIYE